MLWSFNRSRRWYLALVLTAAALLSGLAPTFDPNSSENGGGEVGPKTPLKSPLVQGGTLFSSDVVPPRGMSGSSENPLQRMGGFPTQTGWVFALPAHRTPTPLELAPEALKKSSSRLRTVHLGQGGLQGVLGMAFGRPGSTTFAPPAVPPWKRGDDSNRGLLKSLSQFFQNSPPRRGGFSSRLAPQGSTKNSPEQEIERHLQEAQAAEKSRDYIRAVAAYQNILKIRPQWALIHQSLGVVYHLQSRFPEAISSLQTALKLDPSLWGSQLFLGMGYYRTNEFTKAIPVLEQSIKLNPKMAEGEARLWLGSSFLALSRFDEALEQFRRLAVLKPRDLEALYNLAEVCNRYSSALFEKITVSDPESAEAHRLQAEYFEWQEKTDEGIGEYVQAAKARPDWEGIHLSIGNLYLRKSELSKAAPAFEDELRVVPNDPTAAQLLQATRAKLGSTEHAVDTRRQGSPESKPFTSTPGVGTADVGEGPSLFTQGVHRFRARDFAGAEALLGRALRESPKDALAKLYLARCNFSMGNYDQAIELLKERGQFGSHELEAFYWTGKSYQELAAQTLEKMVGIDPNSYRVHQMTGALLEDKRKYAEAIDAYQKALKPSPDLMGIRFAIGNTYWKMQNLDEALVWLKDELARNPYHASANYRVGAIYLSKGSTDQAVPFLEKAVRANPTLLGAQQDLAKAYTSLGRHEQAIAKLKLVAQADPEDASIRYLLSNAYKKVGNLEAAQAELKAFTQLRAKQDRVRRENLQKRISPDQPSGP